MQAAFLVPPPCSAFSHTQPAPRTSLAPSQQGYGWSTVVLGPQCVPEPSARGGPWGSEAEGAPEARLVGGRGPVRWSLGQGRGQFPGQVAASASSAQQTGSTDRAGLQELGS